jgi:hypothetical protein
MIGQRAFTNCELCEVLPPVVATAPLPPSPLPLLQPTDPPKTIMPKTTAPIIPTASIRFFIVCSARVPQNRRHNDTTWQRHHPKRIETPKSSSKSFSVGAVPSNIP